MLRAYRGSRMSAVGGKTLMTDPTAELSEAVGQNMCVPRSNVRLLIKETSALESAGRISRPDPAKHGPRQIAASRLLPDPSLGGRR